jgi:hypothetical protein
MWYFLFIFISTTYIVKFSMYLCSKFAFCFTNPNHRLIRMSPPTINAD